MKPLPTIDPINRFLQLVNRGPKNTCWDCLANFGKYLADLGKDLAEFGIKLEVSNLSQEMELKDTGKMIENFANLTAEQQENSIATCVEVGNKHTNLANKASHNPPFFVCGLPTVCLPTELQATTSSCLCDASGTSSVTKPKLR